MNQRPEASPGRPIAARGMGDEALARGRAEEARYEADLEAERRANDPFGDILGGSWKDPILGKNVDKWLAEDEADMRTQMQADAALGQPSYQTADAGAAGLEMQLMSMNNSQRDRMIGITMGHEGELSKDKKTNFGIQQDTLNTYNAMNPDAGFNADVALLERKQAAQIYREMYYDEMYYDKYRVGEIDDFSMASHLFDLLVLHGPTWAAMVLQDAIRKTFAEHAPDLSDLDIPGSTLSDEEIISKLRIDDLTFEVLAMLDERGLLDQLQNNIVDRRIEFMRDIAKRDPEKAKNLPG